MFICMCHIGEAIDACGRHADILCGGFEACFALLTPECETSDMMLLSMYITGAGHSH